MLGELPPDPVVASTRPSPAGNAAAERVRHRHLAASRLWLLVAGHRLQRARAACCRCGRDAELVGPDGAEPLASLTPVDGRACARATAVPCGSSPATGSACGTRRARLRHRRPRLHPVARRRRCREPSSPTSDPRSIRRCGSTSSMPSRTWIACCRPRRARRCLRPGDDEGEAVVDRVFWHALGRAPTSRAPCRRGAIVDRVAGALSPDGLADSAVGRADEARVPVDLLR